MATHDIIVVGASAGGVEALMDLVRGLPADLPAAVFVVLHVPPYAESHLPHILSLAGPLPAVHPRDGERIVPGRIYVAPPDRHLMVREGYVQLSRGPRENGSRPAADPLFRSAARVYGSRVVGVILSGALGDGAVGLSVVAARGGVTVVQSPDEALFDSMPRAALRSARVDHMLSVAAIPALLARLAGEPAAEKGQNGMSENGEESPPQIERDLVAQSQGGRAGEISVYTCPECGGSLWQIERDSITQYNCHVGHTFAPETLLGLMSEELEAALWSCVRMLTEKSTLTRQLAERMRAEGQQGMAARIEEQARADDRHGQLIRDALLDAPAIPPAVTAAVEDTGQTPGS